MIHVAWDAIVFIISENKPVNNLNSDQIKAIFSGKIKNWKGKTSGIPFMSRTLIFENKNINYGPNSILFESRGPPKKGFQEDYIPIFWTTLSCL